MADVVRMLKAAIEAIEAGSPGTAQVLLKGALKDLREAGEDPERPWSTNPREKPRFYEYLSRLSGYLGRFEGVECLPVDEAREAAREFFPEEPRSVGPLYKRELETVVVSNTVSVRLTEAGATRLADLRRFLGALTPENKAKRKAAAKARRATLEEFAMKWNADIYGGEAEA